MTFLADGLFGCILTTVSIIASASIPATETIVASGDRFIKPILVSTIAASSSTLDTAKPMVVSTSAASSSTLDTANVSDGLGAQGHAVSRIAASSSNLDSANVSDGSGAQGHAASTIAASSSTLDTANVSDGSSACATKPPITIPNPSFKFVACTTW